MVQDLQAVNKAVIPLYPIGPKLYTILIQIPKGTTWFTVQDLKDAFFCIPLHPKFQYLFAFK